MFLEVVRVAWLYEYYIVPKVGRYLVPTYLPFAPHTPLGSLPPTRYGYVLVQSPLIAPVGTEYLLGFYIHMYGTEY